VTLTPELPELVFVKAMGLLAKACKQYRAVGELAAMGLGDPCDSLSRMMFETMLAIMFVLREQVELKEKGKVLGVIGEKKLTAVFRCQLYSANEAIQSRKIVNAFMRSPTLEDQIPESSRAKLEADAAELEAVIGPDWTKRVKRHGYAGVNIFDLADTFGMSHVYASVYKITSSGVHAADAMSHFAGDVDSTNDFNFHVSPDPGDIPKTLSFASMVMVQIVQDVDARFNFGLRQMTEDLSKKAGMMRVEFPSE
jgi:hypothetical protein